MIVARGKTQPHQVEGVHGREQDVQQHHGFDGSEVTEDYEGNIAL
jgi:hypothetical protein